MRIISGDPVPLFILLNGDPVDLTLTTRADEEEGEIEQLVFGPQGPPFLKIDADGDPETVVRRGVVEIVTKRKIN
jgi:hypothetical protein